VGKRLFIFINPDGKITDSFENPNSVFVCFEALQSARFIHARNRFYFIDPYGPSIISEELLTRLLVSCDSDDLTFDADKDSIEVYNSYFDLVGVLY
jgi:hypothetical protein